MHKIHVLTPYEFGDCFQRLPQSWCRAVEQKIVAKDDKALS